MKKIIAISLLFTSALVHSQTKFGVLVHGEMNVNQKINVAKSLGVSYVRTAIILQNWNGNDQNYNKLQAAGFKIILNVNWGYPRKGGPIPFPTDTIAYKKILGEILEKYKPELVVVENEEIIKNYHTGPIEDYINELSAAISVAHSLGLKVTNGGLTNRDLALLVYNNYLERKMKKEADDFAQRCIKPSIMQGGSGASEMLTKARKLIEAYKRLPLDYVNLHIYEPIKNMTGTTDENVKQITPNALKEIVEHVETFTGKKLVSNESGARTSSPAVVTQMLEELAKANFEYVIWFSGDGEGGAVGLQNEDGSLRPNGVAFRDFVASYKKGQ